MGRILVIGLVGLTGVAVSAPGAKEAPKKDSPIGGEWLVLSIDGQKAIPTVEVPQVSWTRS